MPAVAGGRDDRYLRSVQALAAGVGVVMHSVCGLALLRRIRLMSDRAAVARVGSVSTDPACRAVRSWPAGVDGPAPARLRWWHEVVTIAVFYGMYTAVRDVRGERPVSATRAFHNAIRVIDAERWMHIFWEPTIQRWFVGWRTLVVGLDVFYSTAHFVVTAIVLLVLYFKTPARYRQWRNTLACTTGVALIGFALFPLMPPRLLPSGYHMVDTLRTVGGTWSFDSGPMTKISNQFAAMPSLHFAWSVWSACVLIPMMSRRWAKTLVALYPALTVLCVVVTANHYFLDIAGGAVTLGGGYLLARAFGAAAGRVLRRMPRELSNTNRQ